MEMFAIKRKCTLLAFFILTGTLLFAEVLSSPSWGYTLDLPEGCRLIEKSGTDTYLFESTIIPMEILVASYRSSTYTSAEKALKGLYTKLKASGEISAGQWRNHDMALCRLIFPVPGGNGKEKYAGWALSLELPEKKGYLVMAAYTPEKDAQKYQSSMLSALDAVFTDRGSWFAPGPVTGFTWPATKDRTYVISINGKNIEVLFDNDDIDANQYVIDREFEVLTLYMNTDKWKEAWQRYYRAIYRDAYKRLQRSSFAIYNSLALGEKPITGERELAELLLKWTQQFTYTRVSGSDFISLPETLLKGTGDCDSRALLLAILLNQMNCRTTLFISPEYSHAFAGFELPGEGARMSTDAKGTITGTGKNGYLLGETTAEVPLGKIPRDMADPGKWFAVIFPE